jgi:hypothetical protein
MAATTFGSGTYGITSEAGTKGTEAHLYIGSLSLEASVEEAFLTNHEGEDVGVSLYNESATINADGYTVTAEEPGQDLATLMTIAGDAIYSLATSVATFYVNSVSVTRSNTDFQQGSFTATGRPGITVS